MFAPLGGKEGGWIVNMGLNQVKLRGSHRSPGRPLEGAAKGSGQAGSPRSGLVRGHLEGL